MLCLAFLAFGTVVAKAEPVSGTDASVQEAVQKTEATASIDMAAPALNTQDSPSEAISPDSVADPDASAADSDAPPTDRVWVVQQAGVDYSYSDALAGIGSSCPSSKKPADTTYSASDLEDINCANKFAEAPGVPEVPIVVNRNVESFISYFQRSGRKHFERWLGRSQTYMTLIRNVLRENGLPEDLSYIAFIESGLNPTARSRARAVGMWQFVKATAQKYGLKVNWWIDERMDPEKATQAAALYLKDLYDQFGSWYLAAAGYNAGEGRVLRAMKRHRTEDFWALASYRRPLKRETKEYVPKYLAAMVIAKDPKSYGFDEQDDGESIAYDKVRVSQATDLRVIAEAAGTTTEEIKRLNPDLLRWFTPPDYPDYQIKIPRGTAQQFEENIGKIPVVRRVVYLKHRVRRWESLARIAKKYRVPAREIAYLNNLRRIRWHHHYRIRLRTGTVLFIPVRGHIKNHKALANSISVLEYQS